MKASKALRALIGVGLCGAGLVVALSVANHAQTFRIGAGGCRLITDIVEPTTQPAGGMPQPTGPMAVPR